MPDAEVRWLHRASSPSEQSNSIEPWIRIAPATAVARPPNATTTPAATPQTMNSAVTAFGLQPSLANTQVAHGDSLRMYSRPAQCSSFNRAITAGGCPCDLSSASVGPGILLHSLSRLRLRHREALQDRVAARPGGRGERA